MVPQSGHFPSHILPINEKASTDRHFPILPTGLPPKEKKWLLYGLRGCQNLKGGLLQGWGGGGHTGVVLYLMNISDSEKK